MEKKIMTAAEFLQLSGISPENLNIDVCAMYMSLYSQYVLDNQTPPSDVEQAIKNIVSEHLDTEVGDKDDIRASTLHHVKMQSVIDAVTAGYNLALTCAKSSQVDWEKLEQEYRNMFVNAPLTNGQIEAANDLFNWFRTQLEQVNGSDAVKTIKSEYIDGVKEGLQIAMDVIAKYMVEENQSLKPVPFEFSDGFKKIIEDAIKDK